MRASILVRATAAMLLVSVVAVAPRPAAAVDGVIEINQARALAGGVTASDSPGFPVTIDASGSYRLTGNLTVSSASTTAILVTAAAVAVDIDLNGFAILGPVTCTAPPTVTCSPIGAGDGIDQSTGSADNRLRVAHGAIRGMGSFGINAAAALVVDDVQAMYNRNYGIYGGSDSLVSGCEASRNGSGGISVGPTSTVRNCAVRYNGPYSSGIFASDGSVVEHNLIIANLSWGIAVGAGSAVLDNTALLNTAQGVFFFGGVSGYARNVLTGNNGGDANPQVTGPGVEIGTNICGTDTVCP